jgi:hypothetical protein
MNPFHPLSELQVRLLARFAYEPDTGKLIWRRNGKEAGTLDCFGYIQVKIDGKFHRAHRIIWAMLHGAYPKRPMMIDHIDRNRMNNRWDNLRLVTHSQNLLNNAAEGVCFGRRDKKWIAYINIEGIRKYLGYFNTYEEAKEERNKAHVRYNPRLHGTR